jgi:hypothetical protein
MAFVTSSKRGEFEIRESRSTPKGPRSRTLATFRELNDEVIEKARATAAKPPTAEELRAAARRVGATVARNPGDQAARELIAELGKGNEPDPGLRRILLDLLADGTKPRSAGDAQHSIAEWMAATPEERGRALVDLLLLADALPHGARLGKPLDFPPLKADRNSDVVAA